MAQQSRQIAGQGMHISCTSIMQLIPLLFHWKQMGRHDPQDNRNMKWRAVYGFLQEKNSSVEWCIWNPSSSIFYPHFNSSQSFNKNKVGKDQSLSWALTWPPGFYKTHISLQSEAIRHGHWFDFMWKVFKLSAVKGPESCSTTWICRFVSPDSLQRRSTRLVTPLWSSSALTIQSTKKDFTSATPAPSFRTHCTHASDQRGPEGAVRGIGANGGAPRQGASLPLGNLRPPKRIRHDRTAARPPNAPQLLGALAPPTDCEE